MAASVCSRCSQVHERCLSHNNRGLPCGRWPIVGGTVCYKHGAAAPQVKAAAKRNQEAAIATRAVATFGLPRDIDPHSALLEEVHRTAGHVAWLSLVLADVEPNQLKQLDMTGRFEKPSVWLEIYQAERAHYARVAKAAIDAGIEERRVKMAEAQGEQLGQVIRNVLADVFNLLVTAGLAADLLRQVHREQVPSIVRRRLLEMAEAS